VYVFSRLEKLAWKNAGTFVKLHREDSGPTDLLNYLENIYGDPNIRARAARRLHKMRQKEDQKFSKFLPQLEREFADAGAYEWHDEAKRQILIGSLNRTMTKALMNRGIPTTFASLIGRLHEINSDMESLEINLPRRHHHQEDDMDWTPTLSVNRTSTHPRERRSSGGPSKKRAVWVDREEMDLRRDERRCLRCGRDGCWTDKCP
jgi:hypothetical protein